MEELNVKERKNLVRKQKSISVLLDEYEEIPDTDIDTLIDKEFTNSCKRYDIPIKKKLF